MDDDGNAKPDQFDFEADIAGVAEPYGLIGRWLDAARRSEINDAEAMALASVDAAGRPNLRIVLLKGLDSRGLVFYTNRQSVKGTELAAQAQAAACLHWKSLRRQIRVRGPVTPVSDEEADRYFATRSRESRIGAWASAQSRPLESRSALQKAARAAAQKFAGTDIPRPPHWSGFRISAREVEFWSDGPHRLHDRIRFQKDANAARWIKTRLFP